MTATERRWRDGLFAALLPALADLDLDAFHSRFDRAAPMHVALAIRAAGLVVAGILPRLLGHAGSLADLDPEARDRVLARASSMPLVPRLLDVAKVVACLAYFDDPEVEAIVRGRR